MRTFLRMAAFTFWRGMGSCPSFSDSSSPRSWEERLILGPFLTHWRAVEGWVYLEESVDGLGELDDVTRNVEGLAVGGSDLHGTDGHLQQKTEMKSETAKKGGIRGETRNVAQSMALTKRGKRGPLLWNERWIWRDGDAISGAPEQFEKKEKDEVRRGIISTEQATPSSD